MFREIGRFEFDPRQRGNFMSGLLRQEWAKQYPEIFDELDVGIAVTQSTLAIRYHFFEWLAAVLLFNSTGYLSLIEQYQFKKHKRKRAILEKVVPREVFDLIINHSENYGRTQCPDLLVYAPDFSDWFFCEVKGPHDSLKEKPKLLFERLSTISRKPIGVVYFHTREHSHSLP